MAKTHRIRFSDVDAGTCTIKGSLGCVFLKVVIDDLAEDLDINIEPKTARAIARALMAAATAVDGVRK